MADVHAVTEVAKGISDFGLMAMTTAKEIEDYDYTSGYPQKLNLQTL